MINARKLSEYFLYQSLRILDMVETPVQALHPDQQAFYKALPDFFTNKQGLERMESLKEEFGPSFKMSESTFHRMKNGKYGELFRKTHTGHYQKLIEI